VYLEAFLQTFAVFPPHGEQHCSIKFSQFGIDILTQLSIFRVLQAALHAAFSSFFNQSSNRRYGAGGLKHGRFLVTHSK
jgi:hypothetical protein